MQTAPKKVINGWAMYDWANSVYSLVITTTFFITNPSGFDALISIKGISSNNSSVRLERVARVPSVFSKSNL